MIRVKTFLNRLAYLKCSSAFRTVIDPDLCSTKSANRMGHFKALTGNLSRSSKADYLKLY